MRLLILFLSLIFSTILFADEIDNALKAQDSNSNIETSVDNGFYNKASEASSKVRTRTIEIESARAEEWKRSQAQEADARSKKDGAWTLINSKHESGAFDEKYTIKCNVGIHTNATQTIWKNKGYRKFGQYALSTGFSSIDYDTFEKAAKAGCNL